MTGLLPLAITATLVMYVVAFGLGLARLLRGPAAEDRILAVDFLSYVVLLALLVLAIRYDSRMYFDAALLIALFGFVGTAALAKFLLRGEVIE
jgi:multicomponent K+:H+ antiporter subunit F